MTDTSSVPRYTHDCTCCHFLGQFEKYDLYYCKSAFETTVIARWSGEGPDYSSGLCFSYGSILELSVARQRAKAAGLLAYDLKAALHSMPLDTLDSFKEELEVELRKSELGQALIALASDIERGTTLVRNYVAQEAAALKTRFVDKDIATLQDWARANVSNAYEWSRRVGLPCAPQHAYSQALYGG